MITRGMASDSSTLVIAEGDYVADETITDGIVEEMNSNDADLFFNENVVESVVDRVAVTEQIQRVENGSI